MEKIFNEQDLVIVSELCKKYPNDMELGNNLRKEFSDYKFEKSLGNNQDLGREVRKFIKKILVEKK